VGHKTLTQSINYVLVANSCCFSVNLNVAWLQKCPGKQLGVLEKSYNYVEVAKWECVAW